METQTDKKNKRNQQIIERMNNAPEGHREIVAAELCQEFNVCRSVIFNVMKKYREKK